MALEEVLGRCIERWRGEDIPLCPPIGEADIRRIWGRFGRPVSEDILRLYGRVGGFVDGHYTEKLFWSLWPLDRLQSENADDPSAGVKFCDHSLNLVQWELRYQNERQSSVWQVDYLKPGWSLMTATSLESFFRMYLDDPWQLLYANPGLQSSC
jgi:hypothetical protein